MNTTWHFKNSQMCFYIDYHTTFIVQCKSALLGKAWPEIKIISRNDITICNDIHGH